MGKIIGIVCVDNKWNIGTNNDLLFHLKGDMKFFKEKTLNQTVCMGKNTLLSLPGSKPLKNRTNIVLCSEGHEYEGCICKHSFDEIIDLATLTGACVVALGTVAAGIVGNNDELVKNLIKTAKDCGERYWELPMYEEYKESLKSDVADMQNTGSRWGGASTAGLFLREFVKDAKWAHIDIAGTAFIDKPQNEFIKGATGAGVRALLNYILAQ